MLPIRDNYKMRATGRAPGKASQAVLVAVLVAAVCALAFGSPTSTGEEAPGANQQAAAAGKLPALFDFGHYQALFGKKYNSYLEAVSRRAYFLANAFKVYVSGAAYKVNKQNYYLALNHYSDLSPRELERMENKALAGELPLGGQSVPAYEDSQEAAALDAGEYSEVLENELEKEILDTLDEAERKNLLPVESKKQRRKREADAKSMKRQRSLSLDQLIKSNEPVPEPPQVRARLVRNPKSDNPNYDPLQVEAMTMGLNDQIEDLTWWKLHPSKQELKVLEEKKARGLRVAQAAKVKAVLAKKPDVAENGGLMQEAIKTMSRFFIAETGIEDEEDQFEDASNALDDSSLPDEMFTDLRKTGCLFQPRDQGLCGSCYAFAGITMIEYYHCLKTGRLMSFSEQYLIDCGKGRFPVMDGCGGGIPTNIPAFTHNFGVELRRHYPYSAQENHCPYDDDTDLKKTGFIRMPLGQFMSVHMASWETVLKRTPIYVSVATPRDFSQYGGGVYDGMTCREKASHAMVVVGHGREDGQEFWLIRNSHGAHWGTEGHWKLAKSALDQCIEHRTGYIYGTKDSQKFRIAPELNYDNSPVVLKQLRPLSGQKKDVDPHTLY